MKTLPLYSAMKIRFGIFLLIFIYFLLDVFIFKTFESYIDVSVFLGLLCGFFGGYSNSIFNLKKIFFKYNTQKITWKLDIDKEIQEANIDCISNIKEDWKSVYFENNEGEHEIVTANLSKRQKRMIVNLLNNFASRNPKLEGNR